MTLNQLTNNNMKKPFGEVSKYRIRIRELFEQVSEPRLQTEQRVQRQLKAHQELLINYSKASIQVTLDMPDQMEKIRRSTMDLILSILKAVAAAPWASGSEEVSVSEKILYSFSPEVVIAVTSELARSMLEDVNMQYNTIWNVWRPAQKQVINFMIEAIIKSSSLDESLNFMAQIMSSFPTWEYHRKIQSLAEHMWKQSGYPINVNPLDYWVSAEKHLLATTTMAIRNAGSALEVGTALVQTLVTFSAEKRFEDIQRVAFSLYEARGRKHGQDVTDWLNAEKKLCE